VFVVQQAEVTMSHTLPAEYDVDDLPTIDYEKIITEDDAPVDNLFSERQMNLLKDSLYVSWAGPGDGRPFVAMANVGLFFAEGASPLVPDVLVSLDVELPDDPFPTPNRSYFIWRYGKPPDIVVEIVSNQKGKELGDKLLDYARLGIAYYVVYDPDQWISEQPLRIFGRQQRTFVEQSEHWLTDVELGVTLWSGSFQGMEGVWLRWCDQAGNLLLTGEERAQQEHQRAEQERLRAEQEYQRAEQEHLRAERLAAQLRALGIEPEA
jgi:Uma2 family endonuclease